jgi:hypothetical protein
LFSAYFSSSLRAHPKIHRYLNKLNGAVFIGLGIKLAVNKSSEKRKLPEINFILGAIIELSTRIIDSEVLRYWTQFCPKRQDSRIKCLCLNLALLSI